MTFLPNRKYTLDEYIELDKNSPDRYEYFHGEVFAMGGGSPDHARISLNVCSSLTQKLRDRDCEAFNSEMRIKVPTAVPYRYPDASVVCGEPVFDQIKGQTMLVNPTLIIEVLSPSTAAYDLGEKFSAYQSIESVQEYLLISQDRPHVIQHIRQPESGWLRLEFEGLETELPLSSIKLSLYLREIFERVVFDAVEEAP